MSLRWQLLASMLLVLAVNLALGGYAALGYQRLLAESLQIRDQSNQVVIGALRAQVHFKKQVQEWKNILLRGQEPGLYQRYLRQFEAEEALTREQIAKLRLLLPADQALAKLEAFASAHRLLANDYRQALRQYLPEQPQSLLQVDRQVRGIDRAPSDLIDQLVQATLDYQAGQLARTEAEMGRIKQELLLALISLLLISLLLLFALADRIILRPIRQATLVAQRIAGGDLSGPIAAGGSAESAQLLQALQSMQSSLGASQQALGEEKRLLEQRVRQRTQELNLVNEELARAAKAKDLFLASMSHELRTPLTTVIGLTEMLRDQLYGPLNPAQADALQTLDQSAHHLLSLINDILDVAKVESGKIELKMDYVPVQQLVDSALALVRPSAQRKAQQLRQQIDPRLKLIQGDSRRLKQMLVNLLGNAVKFTPEQGQIGLQAQIHEAEGEVELRVWDTGIGIEAGQMDSLFEPFVQLAGQPGGRSAGTGLGLTLVNRMASLHRGRVLVTSTPGQGSSFSLMLPWDARQNEPGELDAAADGGSSPVQLPAQLRGRRILLAEDDAANRAMTRDYLQHQGLAVITAENGLQALNLARDEEPDLILMDIQLEIISGLEVTRKLRAMPGFERLPIVALTAMAMPGDRERCIDAGMDDYISKPLGLKELLQQIIRLLPAGSALL
ncbi:MAG: response regulator [Gammaproteobacteria bacterium]|nr:response regulator [Gammaproteobacteria bacterium]